MIFTKYKMTSDYGNRTLDNGDSSFHNGIDLVGIETNEVLSPIKGKVIQSRIVTDKSLKTWQWGNYICIESADGFQHYFCHLLTRYLKYGDVVEVGIPIGIMGNTGYSFGAHTHYGIKNQKSEWINPQTYFQTNLKVGEVYEKRFTEMTVDEAKTILRSAGLEEISITYLSLYKYGDQLILEIAKAIKG